MTLVPFRIERKGTFATPLSRFEPNKAALEREKLKGHLNTDIWDMIRLFVFLTLLLPGCGFAQDFNFEEVLTHMKTLTSDEYEGRGMDTKGGEMTKEYISYHFDSLGLKQFDSSWLQPFNVMHNLKLKKLKGDNVMGYFEGSEFPDRWIVVSSHHDHMGIMDDKIYNGADDNASGTCALFAVAQYLTANPPRHSVVLVAFDGEETGLLGSKHFVKNLPMAKDTVILNMNMDMISRNDKSEIFLCGKAHYPQAFEALSDLDELSPINVLFGHDGSDKKDNWTFASDHGNFHKADIPFIYFGVEDHKDYHQPTDDFENIHKDFYREAMALVIKVFSMVDERGSSLR